MADPNTRQGKRTPVTLKIKFKSETLEQFIERYAVDVSQGGIFIRTKEPLAVGTQMRFEFQLRDASPLIGGEGTVVWTRENDPSRPAIAPGMGVRFDRLAEGSQSVLEKILAEKAKQAPQRTQGETAKPPMFTDVPTRVAPPPVQDALLGGDSKANRRRDENSYNDQQTPLPKPMPFHSDADEFPEEAFEEATKVRALDDLVAQTANDGEGAPGDELAARRGDRVDATVNDTPSADPAATAPGFASGKDGPLVDRDSAPGLPSPPEAAHKPRLLDTTPSPHSLDSLAARGGEDPMEKLAKTKIGLEPAHVMAARAREPSGAVRDVSSTPASGPAPRSMPSMPVAANEPPPGTSSPMAAKRSSAPLVILILVLLAAAGAGVWFFVLRDRAQENNTAKGSGSSGSSSVVTPGSGSGSDVAAGSGSGSAGSAAVAVGSGSQAEVPAGPTVETEITANVDKANVEILGTSQSGPAPFKAKLEKGKPYKARVTAPGYATVELDLKGGDAKQAAKLVAKPKTISIKSEPAGALIMVDGSAVGHSTPYEVELSKAQAAKKSVRVKLLKTGFKPVEKVIDGAAFTEDDAKLVAKVDEKLEVQKVVRPPNGGNTNAGSGAGSGAGSASAGSGAGSATPPAGSGAGSAAPPPPPPPPPAGGGSAASTGSGASAEPEPDFVKP
ncbi:MAG TPA: TIGR02266 family protein [Kofleriaceae bacterium]|nr:TIGR02266 family protein [Kofleriaceae bacterium]